MDTEGQTKTANYVSKQCKAKHRKTLNAGRPNQRPRPNGRKAGQRSAGLKHICLASQIGLLRPWQSAAALGVGIRWLPVSQAGRSGRRPGGHAGP